MELNNEDLKYILKELIKVNNFNVSLNTNSIVGEIK